MSANCDVIEVTSSPVPLTPVTLAGISVNLQEFFTTRVGFWVKRNFTEFILRDAWEKRVVAGGNTIGFADATQAINCFGAPAWLSDYVFEDVDLFLICLATLIESHNGHQASVLLSKEFTNVFFVRVNGVVYTVNLYNDDDLQEWSCLVRKVGGISWCVGDRVFSASAKATGIA